MVRAALRKRKRQEISEIRLKLVVRSLDCLILFGVLEYLLISTTCRRRIL